jgi:shikimate kinase
MKVFLWGMMGSGKTSTGKVLAQCLGLPWVDLDDRIAEMAGQPVAEVFASKGQQAFRELEQQALQAVLAGPDCVLSCGGGTPCFFDNAAQMNAEGFTVYLHTTVEELARRLADETAHRPLLQDATPQSLYNQLAHLLHKRRHAYRQARLVLDTDGLPTTTVAALIAEQLHSQKA